MRQMALAQRLNLSTLEPVGDPVPVAAQVAIEVGNQASVALSASLAGTVAYRLGAGERHLVWLNRSGQRTGTVGGPDAAQPSGIRLSPDGRTVAFFRTVKGNPDVWLLEAARGVLRRFTFDAERDWDPIWSPDGSRIVFESGRKGVLNLYETPVEAAGTETLLLESSEHKVTSYWAADGRFILK